MQQVAMLFGPVVETRDVLESFLHDRVLVVDWRQKLADASRQLDLVADGDQQLIDLASQIARLAISDLATNPLTQTVATEVEHLVEEVRVPGLPRPEDEDWAF